VQQFIQSLLEEEVTELPGRRKWERPRVVDGSRGYQNGYGRARKLTLGCGTIEVRRPPGYGVWKSVLRAGYCHCLPGGQRL